MSQISVAIVGGDLRFVRLSQILCKEGFNVFIYGLCHPDIPRNAHICASLDELKDIPYIIGPIPFSKDNKCVFTSMCNTYIPLEQFFRVASNSFVLGSVLTPSLIEAFETHHIRYCDIMKMNEIAILNATLTKCRIVSQKHLNIKAIQKILL